MSVVSSDQLNRHIGWILLIAGFAYATWLDPWSVVERDSSTLVGSWRTAATFAQTMVVGMALLQLAASNSSFIRSAPWISSRLTGLGAILFVAGYAMTTRWASATWLTISGALISLIGFMTICLAGAGERGNRSSRVVLSTICFGMLLAVGQGLFEVNPELFLPTYLGPEDGIRLRMLRLAQVAAMVLPVLTLLYQGFVPQADPNSRIARWGSVAMLCGMVGMPTILTVASFTHVEFKVLLPIPAVATFAGGLSGMWLARQHGRPLEFWGWLFIALSMVVGLLMGMYAFEGPLPPPNFVGSYNDFTRRLIRLAHAYCIVFGLVNIFISRELARKDHNGWTRFSLETGLPG